MNCKDYGRKLLCVALMYYYSTSLEK